MATTRADIDWLIRFAASRIRSSGGFASFREESLDCRVIAALNAMLHDPESRVRKSAERVLDYEPRAWAAFRNKVVRSVGME